MKTRTVVEQVHARPSSDGDGVKLLRVFGGAAPERFDPFLLLDEFGSDQANDYIGGFPPHPHRGFETITYMLEGKMEHRDHMENVGLLEDGAVQWMTAGRGVIHSEMPQQTEGKMHGFQLWLNLPAEHKMQAAKYEDVAAENIPTQQIGNARIKAIAGTVVVDQTPLQGYFTVPHTRPLYLDITLAEDASTTITLDQNLNALVYTYDGELGIGEASSRAPQQSLSRLSGGDKIVLSNLARGTARALVLAGTPLKESIVQYGPFVMNTREEIDQALHDYRNGTLTENGYNTIS